MSTTIYDDTIAAKVSENATANVQATSQGVAVTVTASGVNDGTQGIKVLAAFSVDGSTFSVPVATGIEVLPTTDGRTGYGMIEVPAGVSVQVSFLNRSDSEVTVLAQALAV